MESEASSKPPAKRRRRWKTIVLSVVLFVTFVVVIAWRVMFYMPGGSYSGELPPLAEEGSQSGGSGLALAEELKRDVTTLGVTIGPRNLRRPENLAAAAKFVEDELVQAGHAVSRQTYQVEGVDCWNLETEIKGAVKPDEIVVVGAHYDSYGSTPGADDNASGTAAAHG